MATEIKSHGITDRIRADQDKLRKAATELKTNATKSSIMGQDFNPEAPIRIAKAPPRGSQTDLEKKLDGMRAALCSEMNVVYGARVWNDLCGGTALDFAFGPSATTGASDLVPVCGRAAAAFCARGTPAANPRGTMQGANAIMNCDMTAWTASCLMGPTGYDADPRDPEYNQRLYGYFPLDCYCACYDQCTMGQSNVLAQEETSSSKRQQRSSQTQANPPPASSSSSS